MSDNRHNRLVFLSVPESLRGQIENISQNDSVPENCSLINPDIPLPVEIPVNEEKLNLEELTWEMIISGMLSVIAAGPEVLVSAQKGASHLDAAQMSAALLSEWINYYRHFVLAVRPSIMSEFTEAAIMKARNGDFDLALEILDALRGLFPSSPAVTLNRALIMEERAAALQRRDSAEAAVSAEAEDAFQAAEAAYTAALALHPPFPAAQFNAGFFYMGRKDFRRARECFSLYVDSAEDKAKIEQAKSIIKEIDESGLEDESFSKAYKFIQQGNEEEGMRSIHDYIEKYPAVWNGWFILGWALRRLGRWEDGVSAFGKAIELGGCGSDIRNELAICLMESGDLKSARGELESALRDDPENVKIISNMGVLALKNGNNDEASAFFRTVLELDPEDPIANNFFHSKIFEG